MEEFVLIFTLESLLILFIIILLIIIFKNSRKQEINKIHKVDYGKIYCINVVATFVPVNMLSDNIYDFFIFQGCLILGAILSAKYLNSDKEKSK